jgi:hypothetical protein
VIPPELRARGSLGSADYVAEVLYPLRARSLEIVHPRLGDPTLLGPDDQTLEVVFFIDRPVDATWVRVNAVSPDEPNQEIPLSITADPICNPAGLCTARVAPPADLPADLLFGLCLRLPTAGICRPGALQRFTAIPDPLRLAVLTDLHFGSGDADEPAARRFGRLLREIETASPAIHLVAVTGDLAHTGLRTQLQRFVEEAGTSRLPLIVVPGNHDFKAGGIDHYLDLVTPRLDHVTRLGPFTLVALNTGPSQWDEWGRGSPGGSTGLETAQIAWLDLQTAPADQHELVLLHNPPWSAIWSVIGRNRRAFRETCRRNGVLAILAGHTHLNEVYDRAGLAEGLDINCEQDAPSDRMPLTIVNQRSTEPRASGYRRITLGRDGRLGYCYVRVDAD